MRLFDENIKRKELTSETPFKSLFQDINLYDGYGTDRIRNELECWFRKYPDDDKHELRARFRSDDDLIHNHEGAFFELFLHELLNRLGFSLTVHPNISGTDESPDFLACRDDQRFYLEATVSGLKSGTFATNRNEQDVLEKLNTLTSPHFRITFDMQGKLLRTLGRNKVVSPIKKLLDSHDPDEVQRQIDKHGRGRSPSESIQDGDWIFEAWLSPIPPDKRDRSLKRPLILGRHRAKWLDCVTPVRKTLREKAKKYGNLDVPFIVAVHTCDNHYQSPMHDMEVLFGNEQLYYFKDHPDLPLQPDRKPNGVWWRDSKINAFWSFQRIDVWNMRHSASACLYLNPWKGHVLLPYVMYGLPHAKVNGGVMEWLEGEDIREIMEIHAH